MKISFFIGPKERDILQPEPFEIPYEKKNHICSVMVYGDLSKPQVLIVPPEPSPATPISRYWFFMNISWSKLDGFEFNQYSDQKITTSLSSPVGTLRGTDKIQINNNFLYLTFKVEANQEDLGDNDPKTFLETCSKFGIRVADIEFSDCRGFSSIDCHGCKFVNVKFVKSDLNCANFTNSQFTNVKFIDSNLESADFTSSQFSQVEFSAVNLRKSIFDNCHVVYNKSRIDKDEILIFNNRCDLNNSRFVKAILCSKFEDSDLSNVNLSGAKIVASKFYNCTLFNTIFAKSIFAPFGTQSNNSQNKSTSNTELINSCISPQKEVFIHGKVVKKVTISKCNFEEASMKFVDLSHNIITETSFEATDLYKAKLYNCEFIKTEFNGKTIKSANLSSADASFSIFRECNLNEVNLSRVRMIGTQIEEKSDLVRANFYGANLRSSKFSDSDLTGVDFRYADLTLLNLDRCTLNCANFFQTQRGGMDFNIKRLDEQDNSDKSDKQNQNMKSSCTINCIEWSSKRDGQVQINEEQFLRIICGQESAVSVISSLSKGNADFILNNYATATADAKGAGGDLNDSSISVDGDLNDSMAMGGDIENVGLTEDNEDIDQEDFDSSFNESTGEDDNQD